VAESVDPGPHFIVCGDDPLAQRLIDELTQAHRYPVTVILPSRLANHGPQIAAIPGVRVVEAPQLGAEAFLRAGVGSAVALALLQQDDVGNVDAALQAQELNPRLRLVIRMFNMSLGHHIRMLFRSCRVLSDASIAAPAFVASALGEVAPSYVRLSGQTLYVARRADVPLAEVVCGLADTSVGAEPDLLPADEERCDLVLARANGSRAAGPAQAAARQAANRRLAFRTRLLGRVRGLLGALVSRALGLTVLALLLILAGCVIGLWLIHRRYSFGQAAYVTLINAVGGANADLGMAGPEQVIQAVAAMTGIAMVPVLTATVVEAVVNARIAGPLRRPVSGHVVVVGLGNLGTRVIQQLRDLGVSVVAIDKTEEARGTYPARSLGIPLIIGDASRSETLLAASVHTAQALLALSTDDSINLESALQARALNKDLRLVLRLFDGDFAGRVQQAFGIASSKSVSFLAAPAFAAAMLEREVVGTVSVKRQVLLIAEVAVGRGSPLDGGTVGVAEESGVRVIALSVTDYRYAAWAPRPDKRLAGGDRIVVVATRAGLTRLLAAANPESEPVG
jgi:Trk K+ transport system NAD-binding subunit